MKRRDGLHAGFRFGGYPPPIMRILKFLMVSLTLGILFAPVDSVIGEEGEPTDERSAYESFISERYCPEYSEISKAVVDVTQTRLARGYNLALEPGTPSILRIPEAYRSDVPREEQEIDLLVFSLYDECLGNSGEFMILHSTDQEYLGDYDPSIGLQWLPGNDPPK